MAKKKRTASQIAKSNVSRSKAHERQIAKWLTEFSGRKFIRRRVQGRETDLQVIAGTGDIICPTQQSRYNIECKCGDGFSITALINNPAKGTFTEWWHQTCYDAKQLQATLGAEESKKQNQSTTNQIWPMLFFRPITGENWIAIDPDSIWNSWDVPFLTTNCYEKAGPISCNVSMSNKNKKMVSLNLPEVLFARLKDIKEKVDSSFLF